MSVKLKFIIIIYFIIYFWSLKKGKKKKKFFFTFSNIRTTFFSPWNFKDVIVNLFKDANEDIWHIPTQMILGLTHSLPLTHSFTPLISLITFICLLIVEL